MAKHIVIVCLLSSGFVIFVVEHCVSTFLLVVALLFSLSLVYLES